jgi:hypothetical protein
MPDFIDVLKKECGNLYQKGFTIGRTVDGKFEHIPWFKVYQRMKELANGYCTTHNWSFGFQDYVTLWEDKEGKIYAATGWCHIPSDYPFDPSPGRPVKAMPIYFEELSPEKAEELIHEVFEKKERREREIALRWGRRN